MFEVIGWLILRPFTDKAGPSPSAVFGNGSPILFGTGLLASIIIIVLIMGSVGNQ